MKKNILLIGIILLMVSCEEDPASAVECATSQATMLEKLTTFEANFDSTSCVDLVSAGNALVDNACTLPDSVRSILSENLDTSVDSTLSIENVNELQTVCDAINSEDGNTGEEVPITTDNLLGTWKIISQEMGQHITTNSDQTAIPMMGHIMGIAPFSGGFVVTGDVNETFNHMMPMGMGGFVNKSILEMGMMDTGDSSSVSIDVCMLMLDDFSGGYNESEYNCQLACGDLNAEGPSLMYLGNVEVEVVEMDSSAAPDASIPFISIVGNATLTYVNMDSDELDNSRTVTLTGSLSFMEYNVTANTPTDIMELQMGVSMDELMELMDMDDMTSEDMDMSITFNENGTYLSSFEEEEYDYDPYTGEETETIVTVTCNGTWTEDATYGLIVGGEVCSNDDEGEGEPDDWDSSEEGIVFTVTDAGYLIITQSSDSFCELDGGFGFGPDDYYDYDGDDDYNGEDEEECKKNLEMALAFDEGSLETAYIYMSMIFSQDGGSRKMINFTPNSSFSYKSMIKALKRHSVKQLPVWSLN